MTNSGSAFAATYLAPEKEREAYDPSPWRRREFYRALNLDEEVPRYSRSPSSRTYKPKTRKEMQRELAKRRKAKDEQKQSQNRARGSKTQRRANMQGVTRAVASRQNIALERHIRAHNRGGSKSKPKNKHPSARKGSFKRKVMSNDDSGPFVLHGTSFADAAEGMKRFGLDYFYSTPNRKVRRRKSVEFGNYGATRHLASGDKSQANFALHLRESLGGKERSSNKNVEEDDETSDASPPPPPPAVSPPFTPPPPPPPLHSREDQRDEHDVIAKKDEPPSTGHKFVWPQKLRDRIMSEDCDSGEKYVESRERFEFKRGIKPFELPLPRDEPEEESETSEDRDGEAGQEEDASTSSTDDDFDDLPPSRAEATKTSDIESAIGAWKASRSQRADSQALSARGGRSFAITRHERSAMKRSLQAWCSSAQRQKRERDASKSLASLRRSYVLKQWEMAKKASDCFRLKTLSKCFSALQVNTGRKLSAEAKTVAAEEYYSLRSLHAALQKWKMRAAEKASRARQRNVAWAHLDAARRRKYFGLWKQSARLAESERLGIIAASTMHEAAILKKTLNALRQNALRGAAERNADADIDILRKRQALSRLVDWMLLRKKAKRHRTLADTYCRYSTLSKSLVQWQKCTSRGAMNSAASNHWADFKRRQALRRLSSYVRRASEMRDYEWLAIEYAGHRQKAACFGQWRSALDEANQMRRGDYLRGIMLMKRPFRLWSASASRARAYRAAAARIDKMKQSSALRALKEHADECAFRRGQEYKADDFYFFKLASAVWTLLRRNASERKVKRVSEAVAVSFRRNHVLEKHFCDWKNAVQKPQQMAVAYSNVIQTKYMRSVFEAWKGRTFLWVRLHEVNFCRWVARMLRAWRAHAAKRVMHREALKYALLERRARTLSAFFSSWADLADMRRCRKMVYFMVDARAKLSLLSKAFCSWKVLCAPAIELKRKERVARAYDAMHRVERAFAGWKNAASAQPANHRTFVSDEYASNGPSAGLLRRAEKRRNRPKQWR